MANIGLCPVKSEKNFAKLLNKFGEFHAYGVYMKFNNEAPHINKYDNLDFTEKSILEYFRFRNAEELFNYLDNSEGITKQNNEYFIKKDTEKSKERRYGLAKVTKLNELYPGLLNIKNLGISKDFGKRSITFNQPTFKLEVNNAIIDNPTLFQLEAGKEAVDIKLNDKLKALLSDIGISVKNFNDFKNKYGVEAVGVADIINGIVRINEDAASLLTLPEETAHFIIELLGDSPLSTRLLNSIKTNDHYRDILGEEFDSYNEVYGGNESLLVKEAAGKLLGKALVNKFNADALNTPKSTLNLLERLWEYTKKVFKRFNIKSMNESIDEIYGKTAEQFLRQELEDLSLDNLKKDIQLFQIKDRGLNRLESTINKARIASTKRLELYKKQDLSKLAREEKKLLSKLIEQYEDESYLLGAVNIAKHTRERFKGVNDRLIELKKQFDNIEDLDLKEAAKTLKSMKNFSDSYLPLLEELETELDKLQLEDLSMKRYGVISSVISDIRKKAKLLEAEYYELSVPLFAKYLRPFAGSGPIKDLESALKETDKDISFWQRWLDSMAEASDDILKIIDVAVKDAKQEAQDKSLDIQKDLIQAAVNLEKTGIKNTDWIYEKNSKGKLTGYFVTEYNHGDYEAAKMKFSEQLSKKLGLPLDRDEKNNILASDINIKHSYDTAWAKWFEKNTQPNPNAKDIIETNKKSMTKEEFDSWYSENVNVSFITGKDYYINQLVLPSNKYRNKEFTNINTSKAKKEFYDIIMRLKEDMDNLLPVKSRSSDLAPQLRKDFIQRVKSIRGIKDIKQLKEELKESFIITEDETELGNRYKLTDVNGKPVNFLPVHFTSKLKDMDNLSTDVVTSMASYVAMAQDYSHMNRIIDILEIGRDIVSTRDVVDTDSKDQPLVEKISILGQSIENKLKKDPSATRIKERIDDYYNMVVYGKMRAEGKDINIFGTKVDSEKLIDFIGKYTAINNLALNVYAGLQNPVLGSSMIRVESAANQFISPKDSLKADQIYAAQLPKTLAQIGKRNQTNKLQLWIERMDVLQDFRENTRNLDIDRKTVFSRLFKTNSLFFINQAGEHYLQSKMSLALANKIKLKDSNGKEISLWEAYEVKDNKIILKRGLKKEDGTEWTDTDTRAFIRRQHFVNKSLHGIYNDIDKSAVQQVALGRLALMFRKFMRPGFNRRFRKLQYNYEGQAYTEGYYRTGGRFLVQLIKDLRHGQFKLISNWKDLSDLDRYNMIRSITESAHLIGAIVLANILSNLDDDEWMNNMLAYQSNRLVTELAFFLNPNETFRILKSPAAGVDQVNDVINFLELMVTPWKAAETLKSGKYKGYSRFHRSAVDVIPLYKTISGLTTPEDKLLFFTGK